MGTAHGFKRGYLRRCACGQHERAGSQQFFAHATASLVMSVQRGRSSAPGQHVAVELLRSEEVPYSVANAFK